MAYTLGNNCAKNLCKRTVLLQFIIKNVVTCFFWNTVYISLCFTVSVVNAVTCLHVLHLGQKTCLVHTQCIVNCL